MQDFGHRGTCDVCALPRQAAFREVTAGMLAIGHVYIGDYIHYAAVGLFWKAFILAAVSGFHMEYRDMESLGAYDAQAAVGVSKDQDGVRFSGYKQFIAAVDYISACGAEVIPYCIHIDLWSIEFEILEEDTVQIVVIVLPCMGKYHIEVSATFVDDRCQTYDFRTGADYDNKFEFSVFLEFDIRVIVFRLSIFHIVYCFSTGSKYVSGRSGLKISLQYITVTRS